MNAPVMPSLTADDLLQMPDGDMYELSNGRLEERNMGAASARAATRLLVRIGEFADSHDAGDVFMAEVGYQIFPDDPTRVRKPDLSFVRRGRFPDNKLPQGHCRVVPDLIAESVSPNDLAEDIENRITQYLRAGVALVWVIYPLTHTIYVIRQNNSGTRLTEAAALDGEDVLPGFSCPIAPLFANM